jgi:hypothetical protein
MMDQVGMFDEINTHSRIAGVPAEMESGKPVRVQ